MLFLLVHGEPNGGLYNHNGKILGAELKVMEAWQE
jgi:hypothetical protein